MQDTERLALARMLVRRLEAGDDAEAQQLIDQLSASRESALLQEVRRLTRALHEAIDRFLVDERIAELVQQDIPDACERLNYVIKMTEESANNTLTAFERGLSLVDELARQADDMAAKMALFDAATSPAQERDELLGLLGPFVSLATGHSRQLRAKLTDVLMAQELHDLTGQIIRQVITLVQDIEETLAQLVRVSGAEVTPRSAKRGASDGPAIPGLDNGDLINDQDEVDNLLSGLGF